MSCFQRLEKHTNIVLVYLVKQGLYESSHICKENEKKNQEDLDGKVANTAR